jgi:hypothetical protein
MKRWIPIGAIIALGLMLGGCDPVMLGPAGLQSICDALVGPIKYNTYNPKSPRHAGLVLGMDLKQRNQIGQRLGCPLYKTRAFSGAPLDAPGRKF